MASGSHLRPARGRSNTITVNNNAPEWNRRGLNRNGSRGGRHLRLASLQGAVGAAMTDSGYPSYGAQMANQAMHSGMSGLAGWGCDETGGRALQSVIGASGMVTGSLVAPSETTGAQPAKPLYKGDVKGQTPSFDTMGLVSSLTSAVSSTWGAVCESRQSAQAGGGDNPLSAADAQALANLQAAQAASGGSMMPQGAPIVAGVPNQTLLLGAGAVLVLVLVLRRK